MSARLGYQYVVLRLVPNVAREEFINVAVVLYCQRADFLDSGFEPNHDRWQSFSPTIAPAEIDRSLEVVQRICAGAPIPGLPDFSKQGQRFGWIAAPRSTTLQPGPVHGGTTNDPAAELDRLVDSLVR